jgi:metal-responsive CopG/Arc/MetJ family transcriptional regulator
VTTIQVVLDAKLLRATDRAAGHLKLSRSALIRNALREHLRRLQVRELKERDRKGYQAVPSNDEAHARLETEAAWPEG